MEFLHRYRSFLLQDNVFNQIPVPPVVIGFYPKEWVRVILIEYLDLRID